MNYQNVGTIAALLVVCGAAYWWLARAPDLEATSAMISVVPAVRPAVNGSTANARKEAPARSPEPQSASVEWRNAFDHGAGVVEAFAAAVHAAENGDPPALLIVRNYVAQCARFFGSPYQSWMEKPEFLPSSGGLEELIVDERCMLIARAPEFAERSREDRLSPAYWERVAERVDEPLAASFRVSAALARLVTAQPGEPFLDSGLAGSRSQARAAIR